VSAESIQQVFQEAYDAHRDAIETGTHLFSQLDLRSVEVEGADCAMELALTPSLTNPRGALQGGLIATLADIVAGQAVFIGQAPDFAAATADLSVHYLAPVMVGPARGEAHILRRGRTTVVVRVDIRDVGADRLAAASTVTYTVLPARVPSSGPSGPSGA